MMGHGIHIVGGGLTGYAAALTLAQAGFPTHLYQPDVPADDTLRTTTINPMAYDMLDQLGIIDTLPNDALTPIHQIIVTDDAERTNPLDAIMSWGNDKKNDDTDVPLAWVIGNMVLVRAMQNMIAKNNHITLHHLPLPAISRGIRNMIMPPPRSSPQKTRLFRPV